MAFRLPSRRQALVALAVAGAASWVVWGVLRSGAEKPKPRAPADVRAAAASDVAVHRPSAAASRAAVAAPAVPKVDARSALAERMKADWCGFGSAERDRQAEAVFEKARAASGAIGPAAIEELKGTVGAQLLREAEQRAVQRWAAALNQRGDARSRAVAELLLSGESVPPAMAARARARLQALARTSHDPMVTALALQFRCAPGACQNVDAAQWSRLEPDNALAWLALLDNATDAGHTQTTYAMDRIASQASHSRDFQREVAELLWTLPQTSRPGLDNEAEIELLSRFGLLLMMPSARPIVDACRRGLSEPAMPARCEAVATRLWQDGGLVSRAVGVALMRSVLPLRPGSRSMWEDRARELDAVRQWSREESEQRLSRLLQEGMQAASPCDSQAVMRQLLHDQFGWDAWPEARSAMRAAAVDEAALAAAWRLSTGRSSLDAPNASPPASAGAP